MNTHTYTHTHTRTHTHTHIHTHTHTHTHTNTTPTNLFSYRLIHYNQVLEGIQAFELSETQEREREEAER